jgi:hypothetical protein
MEQIGYNWTDFHKILYSSTFRKPVEKIQVPLKSDKNNGYFRCVNAAVADISTLRVLMPQLQI